MKTTVLPRFLYREITHTRLHGLIFILCVALSLTTLTALNSFKAGVNKSLFKDARELHGADIILHSHYPLSSTLHQEADALVRQGQATSTMIHEFYSVVRTVDEQANLYAKIKVVDRNFPLYGRVELESGKALSSQLQKGTTVVARDVLQRLGLSIGDQLNVGAAGLRIVDVVNHEPDSPSNLLNFGPRVFVSADDLARIDLVKKGSRIQYERLLKLTNQENPDTAVKQLRQAADKDQERVNSYKEEGSRLKRFFDNLLFFLSLISIFTLLLAGLGMQSCLTALVRQKQQTIAIARAMGASNGFISFHYLLLVLLLGLIGSLLGIIFGWAVGGYLPTLFRGLLPIDGGTSISFADVGEGLTLGLAVVLLFTFLPAAPAAQYQAGCHVPGQQRRQQAQSIGFASDPLRRRPYNPAGDQTPRRRQNRPAVHGRRVYAYHDHRLLRKAPFAHDKKIASKASSPAPVTALHNPGRQCSILDHHHPLFRSGAALCHIPD